MCLVNCTGNPQVFLAVPVPIPMAGFTCEPAGFPVETSPRSSKMVKYWVSYEQNNQIDHKPLNIYQFWMIQGLFWSHRYRNPYPYPYLDEKPAQNPWVYPYPCNTLDHVSHHTMLETSISKTGCQASHCYSQNHSHRFFQIPNLLSKPGSNSKLDWKFSSGSANPWNW